MGFPVKVMYFLLLEEISSILTQVSALPMDVSVGKAVLSLARERLMTLACP